MGMLLGVSQKHQKVRNFNFFLAIVNLIALPAHQIGPGDLRKETDNCIYPRGSDSPSVVIEVGDSESLRQLHIDARRWLESTSVNVSLSFLLTVCFSLHRDIPRFNWLLSSVLMLLLPLIQISHG
jgi:hypothetical protein